MALILFSAVFSTGTLILPSLTGALSKRDIWLSPMLGFFIGALSLLLAIGLSRSYPNETIIQQCTRVLGSYLGKGVSFFYLLSLVMLTGASLFQYLEFVKAAILPQTPDVVIIGSMLVACGLAARGGLELIARTIQIVIPVSLGFYAILLILSLQSWDIKNILPLLEQGFLHSLKGSFPQALWFSELFLISFLLPFLKKGEKKFRWGLIVLITLLFNFIVVNVAIVSVLGVESHIYIFAMYKVIRYISYANFFEHLDAIALAAWMIIVYAKISFLLYITTLGTAQWLHLSDYRPLIWSISLLVGAFGIWTSPTIFHMMAYLRTTGLWHFSSFLIIIPAILLGITFFRKRREAYPK